MAPDDDPKVKQLLDAATQRELERWFGLPSFEQVAETAPAPDDPDVVAARERRDKALAAVDPAMVERHRQRTEVKPETLLRFIQTIDVRVDPGFALLDHAMIDRGHTIAEPREVEISEDLKDDLRDCTPQALLRDLHRPELEFDKQFELVDMAAAQRMDIVAEVAAAMAKSWKLPPLGVSPWQETRKLLAEIRAERGKPWADVLKLELPNRRVQG